MTDGAAFDFRRTSRRHPSVRFRLARASAFVYPSVSGRRAEAQPVFGALAPAGLTDDSRRRSSRNYRRPVPALGAWYFARAGHASWQSPDAGWHASFETQEKASREGLMRASIPVLRARGAAGHSRRVLVNSHHAFLQRGDGSPGWSERSRSSASRAAGTSTWPSYAATNS